jgi:hypothetical protein
LFSGGWGRCGFKSRQRHRHVSCSNCSTNRNAIRSVDPRRQERRAVSRQETRPRVFLTAAVGTDQAVRARFPRHAPACSGVGPSLVLRAMSPGVLCCCLAFISRTKSSAVRRCLRMESPHRVNAGRKVLLEYCSPLNECLPAMVADHKAGVLLLDGPGRGKRRGNYRAATPLNFHRKTLIEMVGPGGLPFSSRRQRLPFPTQANRCD